MAKISIIIRTKNEERWVTHCLKMLYLQDFKDFDVILVDNNSSDGTVNAAKKFKLKSVINVDKFLPGKALNLGIKASTGKYIVCLSAHCIPKNTNWLSKLLSSFDNNNIAGVYGRQLPVSFTDEVDKRDLITVFGEDRRVQVKDYFFHNANSMIRRDLWDKFPFDEEVTNVEDRLWGKQVISAGYQIIYEPDAAVYHYHGLNHGNSSARAKGVVSIIEQIDFTTLNELPNSMRPENLNIAAILLMKGKLNKSSNDYDLLVKTVTDLKKSKYLKEIYIVSQEESIAIDLNISWVNKDHIPDSQNIGVDELVSMTLKVIEETNNSPEAIMYINHDYLNRPEGIIDEIIYEAQYKGYDSIFPGFLDYAHYWRQLDEIDFAQIDSSMKSRNERLPLYRALYGLGCFSTAEVVRLGKLVGGRVGIHPIHDIKYVLRNKDFDPEKDIH
jgi:glycosyltransferase involved in cell wall biosynthesis